jgi:hypothetical protein
MATYKISVEALQSLGSGLDSVATEFQNANTNSDGIAGGVGRSNLRDTVHDFAHGWDDTRADMEKAITSLRDGANGVAQGWYDFDQQGATSLTSSGS